MAYSELAAPAISIIMAARNEERYLALTLDSIMGQTFRDYELICVNDGSSDSTEEIIKRRADPRIKLIVNEKSRGLTASLNQALQAARGKYIARADADDLYHPDRLKNQKEFLDRNPDHVAVSCAATFIDEEGRVIGHEQMPEDDSALRWRYLFNSPFMHPAVMLRGETIRKNNLLYDETLAVAQDYELWSRLLSVGKGANLRKRLYIRRDRMTSISRQREQDQHKVRDLVSKTLLERQFPDRHIDMELISRLRDRFVNRTNPASYSSAADIEAYTNLLDDFAKRTGERKLQRRELILQGTHFLKQKNLSSALPFFRELYRVVVQNVA